MALTIDEELSLHNQLLTELDDDVTVTHSRMKVHTPSAFRSSCLLGRFMILIFMHTMQHSAPPGVLPLGRVTCSRMPRALELRTGCLRVRIAGGSEACAADPAGFRGLQVQLCSLWPGARPGAAGRPAVQAVMTPGAHCGMDWSCLM